MTRLVTARETHIIVLTVHSNVLLVALAEALNGSLDGLHTTLFAHRQRREVGVAASAVPLTRHSLRVHRHIHTPFLSDTVEQVAGHREVVTHLNALARTDLELPLRWHHFSVDARVVDTGVKACTVVSLDNITTHDTARADTTVVRTLRSGETALGPAIRTAISAHKRVLLLNTKPAMLVLALLKDLRSVVAVVGFVRRAIIVVALGQNEHVVAATEGIREVRHGAEVHVRVVTRSLACRRTVKVPLL